MTSDQDCDSFWLLQKFADRAYVHRRAGGYHQPCTWRKPCVPWERFEITPEQAFGLEHQLTGK